MVKLGKRVFLASAHSPRHTKGGRGRGDGDNSDTYRIGEAKIDPICPRNIAVETPACHPYYQATHLAVGDFTAICIIGIKYCGGIGERC